MNGEISIVIIGRNEQRGITECVAAAQAAAAQIGGAEILYVDSASTDDTVKIVRAMGVRVLSLNPEQKLCPSAGRSAGSLCVSGEFILFLDADTLIYRDFLSVAVAHFRENPRLAGINGRIDDKEENGVLYTDVEDRFDDIAETEWLRGPACFYRRSALIAARSFNPLLIVEEEAELGLRLLKNGWKLQLLPIPMACHTRCYHNQTFDSIFKSFYRDVKVGRLGEVVNTITCAFRQGFGLRFIWLRLKTTVFFSVLMLILALTLFLPKVFMTAEFFGLFAILSFFAVWFKKRSLYQAALFFPAKLLCLIDVIAGIPKISFKDSDPQIFADKQMDCK